MAWNALDRISVVVKIKTAGTQRDALIQLHVVANYRRSTYNDTSTVVDCKVVADDGTRMYVNPRLAVSHLGNHARNNRYASHKEFVSYAVVDYRLDCGIAVYDLGAACSSGVAHVDCLHVGMQNFTQFGKFADELCCYLNGTAVQRFQVIIGTSFNKGKTCHNLILEKRLKLLAFYPDIVLQIIAIDILVAEESGNSSPRHNMIICLIAPC